MTCDFYENPYLFSGFLSEDPFYFNAVCALICTRFNCLCGHLMFLHLKFKFKPWYKYLVRTGLKFMDDFKI